MATEAPNLGMTLFSHPGERYRCAGCHRIFTLLAGPGWQRCCFCKKRLVSFEDLLRREGRLPTTPRHGWHQRSPETTIRLLARIAATLGISAAEIDAAISEHLRDY